MFLKNVSHFKSKIDKIEMSCSFHVFYLSSQILPKNLYDNVSSMSSNSLQEGEHNLQEMKPKYPAWSWKSSHMYDIGNIQVSIS